MAVVVHDHVFQYGSVLNGSINVRFFFFGEVYHFSVTSSFKIKYCVFGRPSVLIVSY